MKNISAEARERIRQGAIKGNTSKKEKAIEKYLSNPKQCLFCKKILPYEKRRNDFCNKSCSASYNNMGICRNPNGHTRIVKVTNERKKPNRINYCLVYFTNCLFCGKSIISKKLRKYCNNNCQLDYQMMKRVNNNPSSQTMRNYLIKKYGCCQICGWKEINIYTKKSPLELHHIDNNHLNNDENNLQLLCPNCHSLTERYKGNCKKSTRDFRSKYYKPALLTQLEE